MRRRTALVAAVLAALLAGSCKPSSTDPLFIGTKGPADASTSLGGSWSGTTAAGNEIAFQVASDVVADFRIRVLSGACGRLLQPTGTFLIEGNTFTISVLFDIGSRLILVGTFTSSTTCEGSYSYRAPTVVGVDCPPEELGTFRASKVG